MTSLVKAGGGGTYTVANVQAGTGADRHAGWSLVVAYQDASQPARNLTIFDGFGQVALRRRTSRSPSAAFKTPLTGAVNTQIGVVAYEGDLTLTGDAHQRSTARRSPTAAHPAANFFNSAISKLGTPVTSKTPNYVNQLGFDAGVLAVPAGVVANGATSATIDSRHGERPLSARASCTSAPTSTRPRWCCTRPSPTSTAATSTRATCCSTTISSTNTGQSAAYDSRIDDAIPPHTTFVPGSLKIVDSPGGVAGDKTGSDRRRPGGVRRRRERGALPRGRGRNGAQRSATPCTTPTAAA